MSARIPRGELSDRSQINDIEPTGRRTALSMLFTSFHSGF
jgi:hypothetical protein